MEPYVANKVAAVSVTDTQLRKKLKTIHEKAQKILELSEAEVDLEDYLAIDLDLHEIFLQAAGDTLLKEVLTFVGDRSLRIRTYLEAISQKITSGKGQKIHEITEEHKEIIECLLKGDSTRAQKKVLEHLIKGESRTFAIIRMKDEIDRAALCR
jgi:DNA-binding FadR family transcriptional regulator